MKDIEEFISAISAETGIKDRKVIRKIINAYNKEVRNRLLRGESVVLPALVRLSTAKTKEKTFNVFGKTKITKKDYTRLRFRTSRIFARELENRYKK